MFRAQTTVALISLILAQFTASGCARPTDPGQLPLTQPANHEISGRVNPGLIPRLNPNRELRGRFLHITDIHPDELYLPKSMVETRCHYLKPRPKKGDSLAGEWGTPKSDCDTPLNLFNITMEWLEEEWADKIDFVIWTGDNARHDNDEGNPRTVDEIVHLNQMVADRMERIFLKKGVAVIPSLGNNDIWRELERVFRSIRSLRANFVAPYTSFSSCPNTMIHRISSAWTSYIPFESYQVFQRGAYFALDLIPRKIGALSLNTIYWYEKNKAVDGCKKGEPGRLELEWMEAQLGIFRERNMQVYLSGHVPPSASNYADDCFWRYGEIVLRYQDTIVGQLFGHMNNDHFFWIDTEDVRVARSQIAQSSFLSRLLSSFLPFHTPPFGTLKKKKKKPVLHDELLVDFSGLPKVGKVDLDDFTVINVAPSVVPTYYPSIRVFTYNVTAPPSAAYVPTTPIDRAVENGVLSLDDGTFDTEDIEFEELQKQLIPGNRLHKKKVDCRRKKYRNKKSCRLKNPRHASPASPSRRNTLWTPLGYSQFYIPDLDEYKKEQRPQFSLEYMTYDLAVLDASSEYPVPHRLLPEPLRNSSSLRLEWEKTKNYVPYELADLTIESWLQLARRLGTGKHPKLWKRFKTYMYMA
ncbi:Metallo-dependent phosphatase-like protein [Cantharellus anzutake]|uniref:Metallo-dependent phosphatase-like protein n=1 Tax=Cantharellus anzutake TaxID=1750568 RepID=UPI00190752F4|nr:Metallo-dependent phosphatase-like protein [Cantharellus anzutake]KAF8341399.1 Metallo-dependent phosphatase-like protein [Cantharellus anzutake]